MMNSLLYTPREEDYAVEEWIEIFLKLTIKGTVYNVWGSNVKHIQLHMTPWGFKGQLDFWMNDDQSHGGHEIDTLHTAFLKPDLIELELKLRPLRPQREDPKDAADPLIIKAVVSDKSYFEQAMVRGEKAYVLSRRYSLHFHDPASLFWGQHYPCALYTNKAMKDVFDAHIGSKIKFKYEAALVSQVMPLIFLGHDPDVVGGSSFYDLLIWYCKKNDIQFVYDYKLNEYSLVDTKKPFDKDVRLDTEDVARIQLYISEVSRVQARVLNSYSEAPTTKPTTQPDAEAPLWADRLIRTPIADVADARFTLEKKRLRLRDPEVVIHYKRLPALLLGPGEWYDFTGDLQWEHGGFALPGPTKTEKMRVRQIQISLIGREESYEERPGGDIAPYQGRMTATLEAASSLNLDLPEYITPHYPRYVEGKIVSTSGADADETYLIDTDKKTNVDSYKVAIPLWENQEVFAPFNPNRMTGHFYFPAYKHERVICAFEFNEVWIMGFLDWKVGNRLPLETQGNHLLMGKTPENNTELKYVYEQEKPVFLLKRTNAKDNQMLLIKEGYLMIQVKEDK